jgi:hypothetical protein
VIRLDEADADAELGVVEWRGVARLADHAKHLVYVLAADRNGRIGRVRHLKGELPQGRLCLVQTLLSLLRLFLEVQRVTTHVVSFFRRRISDRLRNRF